VRVNAAQRPTKRPTEIQRLGHVVLHYRLHRVGLRIPARLLPVHSTPGRTDLGPLNPPSSRMTLVTS